MKIVHGISIEKYVWVSKYVNIQDFNNIISKFFICFIPFKHTLLTDTLSVVCSITSTQWSHKRKKGL